MRKSRRIKSVESEMPLSAMIDITFLILIYFIVAQKPIIEDAYLAVNLPTGIPGPKPNPTLLKVDVCKYFDDPAKDLDIYYVCGRKWHFNDLRDFLAKTSESDTDKTVIINCDPNARHEKLIRLLDACSETGLRNLNLVNDPSVKFVH